MVAGVHVAILLAVLGKYWWDRESLPRVWARSLNYDPNLPVRGRYVQLALVVDAPPRPAMSVGSIQRARLFIDGGTLKGEFVDHGGVRVWTRAGAVTIFDRMELFLPEHVPDPSVRSAGEELWVEVSVPKHGLPRPVRLGVKKDGQIHPLDLR
jgi:hypothetical protein